MFGVCSLILIQLSFSLRESNAILPICHSSQLLLPVIQSSPHPHPLVFLCVRILIISLVLVLQPLQLLVDVVV